MGPSYNRDAHVASSAASAAALALSRWRLRSRDVVPLACAGTLTPPGVACCVCAAPRSAPSTAWAANDPPRASCGLFPMHVSAACVESRTVHASAYPLMGRRGLRRSLRRGGLRTRKKALMQRTGILPRPGWWRQRLMLLYGVCVLYGAFQKKI